MFPIEVLKNCIIKNNKINQQENKIMELFIKYELGINNLLIKFLIELGINQDIIKKYK